jgi:hypothetical protein
VSCAGGASGEYSGTAGLVYLIPCREAQIFQGRHGKKQRKEISERYTEERYFRQKVRTGSHIW